MPARSGCYRPAYAYTERIPIDSPGPPIADATGRTAERGAALAVRDVSFAYGATVALDGVSLAVPRGSFAALLGANGAGKTTLFSILSGLFSPGGGHVEVLGNDLVAEPRAALARLGIVFQRATLDADLSVTRNLAYFADLHGLPGRLARERIGSALERHGIADVAARRAGTLSGGQRRRVELARALLHRPAVLLMDEATVGLDMPSRREFIAHVRALVADLGVAVLWSTHLADEIDGTDTVHVLERGRLLAAGRCDRLLAQHHADDIESLVQRLTARAPRAAGANA